MKNTLTTLLLIVAMAFSAQGAAIIEPILIGATAGDGTGDTLRTGAIKMNHTATNLLGYATGASNTLANSVTVLTGIVANKAETNHPSLISPSLLGPSTNTGGFYVSTVSSDDFAISISDSTRNTGIAWAQQGTGPWRWYYNTNGSYSAIMDVNRWSVTHYLSNIFGGQVDIQGALTAESTFEVPFARASLSRLTNSSWATFGGAVTNLNAGVYLPNIGGSGTHVAIDAVTGLLTRNTPSGGGGGSATNAVATILTNGVAATTGAIGINYIGSSTISATSTNRNSTNDVQFNVIAVPYSIVSGTPTTVAGAGLTDAATTTQLNTRDLSNSYPSIFILTDSTGALSGTPGAAYGWPYRLSTNSLLNHAGFANLGFPSETLSNAVVNYGNSNNFVNNYDQYRSAISNKNWVIVSLGVNDINNGRTFAQLTNDFGTMWALLRVAGARIVQPTVLYNTAWNSAQKTIWTNINFYLTNTTTIPDFTATLGIPSTGDGIHPDASGSLTISQIIAGAITNAMPRHFNAGVTFESLAVVGPRSTPGAPGLNIFAPISIEEGTSILFRNQGLFSGISSPQDSTHSLKLVVGGVDEYRFNATSFNLYDGNGINQTNSGNRMYNAAQFVGYYGLGGPAFATGSTTNDTLIRTDGGDTIFSRVANEIARVTITGLNVATNLNVNRMRLTNAVPSMVAVFDSANNLTSGPVTLTALAFLDATSSIQTQLNAKLGSNMVVAAIGYLDTTNAVKLRNVTASRLLLSDAASQVTNSVVTATEAGYLAGVTSAIQTQLDSKASANGGTNATHTTPTIVGGSHTGTNLIAGAMGPIEQPAINGNLAFPTNLVWKFSVNDTNNFLVGVPLGLIKDWGYTFKFSTTNGGARLSPSWTNVNQIVGTTNLAANTITSFKVIFDGTNTIAYNLNDTNTPAYLADVIASTNGVYRSGGTDVAVADGGTGISSGTSGGVLAFTASGTIASSGALAANALVIGGGAGVAPSTTTTGAGILTFLGTPSSANLLSAVTDETGSGALVFGTAPQISTIELGNASDTTLSRSAAGLLAVEGNVLVSRSELATSNYSAAATAPGTNNVIFYTNGLVLNTVYTNTFSDSAGISMAVSLMSLTAVTDNAKVGLWVETGNGSGNFWKVGVMDSGGAVISNQFSVFSLVPPFSRYYGSNESSGGATAVMITNILQRIQTSGTNAPATNFIATATGTATQTNTITTTANEASANIGTLYLTNGLYRTVDVPAGAMISNITLGATFTSLERFSPTNRQDDVFIFADGTTNLVSFSIAMPEEWDRSTVKVKFYWTTTNSIASQTNVWGISATAISHDDVMTADWGTEQVVNSPVTAADDLLASPATSALTVAGTPQVGDLVYFRVRRLGGGVNDAMSNAQARLLHVVIQYREAAGTGASAW